MKPVFRSPFLGLLLLLTSLLPGGAQADNAALLQRIVAMEKRIAELEEKLAPVLEDERVRQVAEQQKALARERILRDAEYYSRADLNRIEKMYQSAVTNWQGEAVAPTVETLMKRYPRANRTGCAVLNRARAADQDEKLKLLKAAIQQYGGCYFANGVQVGPYARLYLGMYFLTRGEDQKADVLFHEIRMDYKDAIDHKGGLLLSHLPLAQ